MSAASLHASLEVARPEYPIVAEFDVVAGRPMALVGPNSAGKTTLLMAIAGHLPAARGSIRLGGRDIIRTASEERRVGVVFQEYLLFPHLTVADNVAYGIRMRGARRARARALALPWIERFDLGELAARFPHELSGGQAQRVALARALAAEPEALLLDEP
ncbi:MAG: ATP-binding cassette domain-containing protein, partial [Leifsonia sp.]